MAGTSTYPTTVDNKTALVDGVDFMEGDNVNHAYTPINKTQTFVGATGKDQSWNADILDFLCNGKAPVCVKKDANTITVKAGAIAIKKADGSIRLLRRNTSDVDVVAANLDTGSMADATYYYIYAVADSAATTFTVKFSASATAPTGLTQFELIGWFYNQAAGSLTITDDLVGNVKANGRNVPNLIFKNSATQVTGSSGSLQDDTQALIRFYSSGRPGVITYHPAIDVASGATGAYTGISIDGSDVADSLRYVLTVGGSGTYLHTCPIIWPVTLSAGVHTIQGRFRPEVNGYNTYVQKRIIMVEEK